MSDIERFRIRHLDTISLHTQESSFRHHLSSPDPAPPPNHASSNGESETRAHRYPIPIAFNTLTPPNPLIRYLASRLIATSSLSL